MGGRRAATVGVTAGLAVGLFALWVLTRSAIFAYLPGLRASLWLAVGLACAGLIGHSTAYVLQPPRAARQAEPIGAQPDS